MCIRDRLALISEETYESTRNDTPWSYRPAYVIGSEVPVPGGTETEESAAVTRPADLAASIRCFQDAFTSAGLAHICDDIVAVVAQIGIEFSDESVHNYNREAARALSDELKKYPDIRFESQDVYKRQALGSAFSGVIIFGVIMTSGSTLPPPR